jgi:hypothetical protein
MLLVAYTNNLVKEFEGRLATQVYTSKEPTSLLDAISRVVHFQSVAIIILDPVSQSPYIVSIPVTYVDCKTS